MTAGVLQETWPLPPRAGVSDDALVPQKVEEPSLSAASAHR